MLYNIDLHVLLYSNIVNNIVAKRLLIVICQYFYTFKFSVVEG